MTWTVDGAHATNGTTKVDVMDDGDVHITIGLAGWIVIPIATMVAVLKLQRPYPQVDASPLPTFDQVRSLLNAAEASEVRPTIYTKPEVLKARGALVAVGLDFATEEQLFAAMGRRGFTVRDGTAWRG